MVNDLRHAVRTLFQAKGWTLVVVLSLALGIGANTALFGAVNALFLRKLPVRDPDTLVRFRAIGRNQMATSRSDYGTSRPTEGGKEVRTTFSYPMFEQLRADNRTLEDLFASAPFGRVSVVVNGQADVATAFVTTGNYYQMLGLSANPGRIITPDDDRSDAPPVAVISPRYWRTRFGGRRDVVGESIRINGVPTTIVGVIAPEFVDAQQAVREGPDMGFPLALEPRVNTNGPAPGQPNTPRTRQPTYWWLQIMGRVKPGVTAAQVQANLGGVFQATARAGLDSFLAAMPSSERSLMRNRLRRDVPELRVDSGSHGFYDASVADQRAIQILSVVVVLVLLIVCANVANLLLSKATARQREISVRLSLGATRLRLVRQLLTESLVLATLGGTLGTLIAVWSRQLLPISTGQHAPLDLRVFAFILLVSVASGILFGIAPALSATAMSAGAVLKESSRSIASPRSRLGKLLLVAQVAISVVLLVAAGLFLRTLENLRRVDVGFDTRNLIVFRLAPTLNRYDDAQTARLYQRVAERLRGVPGVRSIAISSTPLLAGSVSSTGLFIAGRTYAPGPVDDINRLLVSPGFFEAMGMPLVAGRGFTERDDQSAPQVVVINEAAVRKYFGGQNPIGQRIGTSAETSSALEIVGVLRDAKYDNLRDPAPPTEYVPMLQGRIPSAIFQLRTAGDTAASLGAIRDAVRQVDPNLPLIDVSTQAEQIEKRLVQERAFAQTYALFAALAVLLASIGLFGVMSYSVARRTNEIGIRMALGARRPDVLRLVMSESMRLVVVGLGIGLAAAFASGRLVGSLLFGLEPTDATTNVFAIALMTIVTAIAGYLPARRAARVDPIVALHYE